MMMLKRFSLLFTVVVSCAIFPPPAFSAEDRPVPAGTSLSIPESSVRDQVKLMRAQRYSEMPYLSRAIINAQIRPETVRAKNQFVSEPSKSLDDIIDRSISVFTPARAGRERISLARRRILAAVRGLFPEINYELQHKHGALSGDSFNSESYRFAMRQSVFHGGILWNTLLQEKLGLESAEKEYESIIEDLVQDVAQAYFEYQRSIQSVDGKSLGVDKMRPYAGISETKFRQELISEIEHLNVQSLFSQMRFEHETSKQEMELAKLELQRFLDLNTVDDLQVPDLYDLPQIIEQGAQDESDMASSSQDEVPSEGADVDSLLGLATAEVPSLDALVDMAYMNRARLRVEAAKLQAARLGERIRWGSLMPQVDVILEFGRLGEAFNLNDLDPGLRREFKFGVELNWNFAGNKVGYTHDTDERAPSISQFLQGSGSVTRRNILSVGVFDGLSDWTAVKEAEIARLDQVVALEKAEKEVVREVKQAYYDFQKARIQVRSAVQRANYRKRQAQLNKHRMEKNEIQISEYLQSEIDYLQESMTLHKALADYFSARARINHAIGLRDFLQVEAKNAN